MSITHVSIGNNADQFAILIYNGQMAEIVFLHQHPSLSQFGSRLNRYQVGIHRLTYKHCILHVTI
jgi:hypothetical protein